MKRSLALGIGVVALSGCALPVPLQVASWALDGISYIATEKSVTDHGLSLVTQKDCALLRGVTEGHVCREWDDAGTLVADAAAGKVMAPSIKAPAERIGYAAAAHSDIPPLNTEIEGAMPNVEMLANFSTAAGPAEPVPAAASQALRPLARIEKAAAKPQAPKLVSGQVPGRVAAKAKAAPARIMLPLPVTATAELPVPARAATTAVRFAAATQAEPAAGIYYVIGSFRNYANAYEFASHYERLVPDVLAAKLDGAPVFRVVVGPVAQGDERRAYRRVADAGLKDSWAIRVVPGDWRLAHKVITRKQRIGIGQELANATR